jgi:hypothetical protein
MQGKTGGLDCPVARLAGGVDDEMTTDESDEGSADGVGDFGEGSCGVGDDGSGEVESAVAVRRLLFCRLMTDSLALKRRTVAARLRLARGLRGFGAPEARGPRDVQIVKHGDTFLI